MTGISTIKRPAFERFANEMAEAATQIDLQKDNGGEGQLLLRTCLGRLNKILPEPAVLVEQGGGVMFVDSRAPQVNLSRYVTYETPEGKKAGFGVRLLEMAEQVRIEQSANAGASR